MHSIVSIDKTYHRRIEGIRYSTCSAAAEPNSASSLKDGFSQCSKCDVLT